MGWKDYRLGDVFSVKNVKKMSIKGKAYIMDKDIVADDGTVPYIAAISTNNGITGYSNYPANNEGDCITLSTTADSSNTVFYQELPFIGRQQIAGIRRLDGEPMGRHIGLYVASIIRRITTQFNYSNKLTKGYLEDCIISLPVKTKYIPDFDLMSELIGGGIDMSSIDTSSWKEFKLDDILQKVNTEKIRLKKGDCPTVATGKYTIPARTATTNNQGLSCYVPADMCTVLNHKISVSANGDFCAFWHDSDFTILQDAYALEGKGVELTENVALFLISVMMHAFSEKYNWNNKSGWGKLRNETISLPVKETEEIDWEYMQERISELEQERISELEQYLIATGLNDYELTDEDREILVTKLIDGGASESSTSGSGCWKEARGFKVENLFETRKVTHKLSKENLSDDFNFPAYSSDTTNNGIIGYTDSPEFECHDKNEVYVTFGDHTRTFNIARKSFSVLDNVKVLRPRFVANDEAIMYIASTWGKGIPNLGYSRHWKVAKDCTLLLPIQTDSTGRPIIDTNRAYHPGGYIPDWSFMETYIRAIEKVTISDVVKYKDEIIQKTKEAVA